jgi:N-methylhydantoinase A
MVQAPKIPVHDPGPADPSAAQRSTHNVWADGVEREVPTFERSQLKAGMRVLGHAIVEQYDATTVILPGHVAEVDPYLNLLITPQVPA